MVNGGSSGCVERSLSGPKLKNIVKTRFFQSFVDYGSNALLAALPRVVLDDLTYVLHDSTLESTIKGALRLSLLEKDALRTNSM